MVVRPYRDIAKPLLDRFVALCLVGVGWPAILAVAAMVRMKLGRPVLFRQVRPGLHGRPFVLLKFRTMTDARDASGALLPDAQRLTPFGRWLRATSLDELPQVANVLRGDLSFIGPRPLLMEYLPLYSDEERRRHNVRPGMTGLAQVSGRNALAWPERLRLDVEYADDVTWRKDVEILARTVGKVLRADGITAESSVTMPRFTGSRPKE